MENDILKLHTNGLSNRQIAISLGLRHHSEVSVVLRNNNLAPNGHHRTKKLEVNGDLGLCTKCLLWKKLSTFKTNRAGEKYPYRLTSCNKCNWSQRNVYLNNTPEAYLRDRYNGLRQHAKRRSQVFDLEYEDVVNLHLFQKGKCAYTKEVMSAQKGLGLLDSTLSFDRVDSNLGYIKGNLLLCTKQFNVTKNNLPLTKLKEWMPELYNNGMEVLKFWDSYKK